MLLFLLYVKLCTAGRSGSGIAAIMMGPSCWLFISCLGWGLAGAAASYFVASVASLLVSIAFIVHLERRRPLHAQCASPLPQLLSADAHTETRAAAKPVLCRPSRLVTQRHVVTLPRRIHWRDLADVRRSWHGWSWDALRGWSTYFRVAVPATAMLCLDWWSYEVVILLAGKPAPSL